MQPTPCRESLSDWFSVGLLSLQRISWQASPGALLEKVMQYESVHPYSREAPWADLKCRLAAQRRVFGFFHASMPDEPLVLLHTALMPNITASLADILSGTGDSGVLFEGDSSSSLAIIIGL